jgi:hypothetical protein
MTSPTTDSTAADSATPRTTIRRTTALLVALVLALWGCTGATDDGVTPEPAGDAAVPSDDAGATTADEQDPLRVLLAVMILTTGDVDAAVAEGVVTPAELDAADAVIASGDVGEWFARAELALQDDPDGESTEG